MMQLAIRHDVLMFNSTELRQLRGQGPDHWVLTAQGFVDKPVNYESLPAVARTAIMTEVTRHIPGLLYAVPFRAVGRCATFAMLPEPSPSRAYIDPPVPFFVGGTLPADIQRDYAVGVNRFLKFNNPASLEGEALMSLVERIARLGAVTKEEMVYFLVQIGALTTGSWRFIRENAMLVEIEETIMRGGGRLVNPARAQALAYDMLIKRLL